jgi:Fe-S oxidoreductase
LKACPLYGGELDNLAGLASAEASARDSSRQPSLAELIQVTRWMASCSGCGMCEEKCQRDVPMTLFISALSHRIRDEAHYTAGSPSQQYPWTGK